MKRSQTIGQWQWVLLEQPTHNELKEVASHFTIPLDMLTAALDPDERPRYENEDAIHLIVIRIPIEEDDEEEPLPFTTRPLGIITDNQNFLITVHAKEVPIIDDTLFGTKTPEITPLDIILKIFSRSGIRYIRYLRAIDEAIRETEEQLQEELDNRHVLSLLKLQKSLVYFTTALRANQLMLQRLRSTALIQRGTEMQMEMFEDVLIDNAQALETTTVYLDITGRIAEAFSSMISNNLNYVMRMLTTITVALMVPTLFSSIYGMNVPLPFQNNPYTVFVIMLVSTLLALLIYRLLMRRW